jgi:hypothetical protein
MIDTGTDDRSRSNAGAASGFIAASQVKTVDPRQADEAVSTPLADIGIRHDTFISI